jgi:hypothetical protein
MNAYVYYTIFAAILLIGLIATLMVGFSRQNREGDPTYFQKTGMKWFRLTSLYVISIAAGVIALVVYIKNLLG